MQHTRREYAAAEIKRAMHENKVKEAAPLQHRREGRQDFTELAACPARIAESARWLYDGSYGHGQMMLARQQVRNARTPLQRRCALLAHIGLVERGCPTVWAAMVWKAQTPETRAAIDAALDAVIAEELSRERDTDDDFLV